MGPRFFVASYQEVHHYVGFEIIARINPALGQMRGSSRNRADPIPYQGFADLGFGHSDFGTVRPLPCGLEPGILPVADMALTARHLAAGMS